MGPGTRGASFGVIGTRERLSGAVWQGLTWAFAILLLVLHLGRTTAEMRPLLVLGFAVVTLVTGVALVGRWERVPPRTRVALPVADLLGASLMVLAVPVGAVATTLLLCSLPAVWLAFEFGRPGTLAGVVVVGALGVTVHSTGGDGVTGVPGSAGVLVPVLFVVGLGVVARSVAETVDRGADALAAQSAEVTAALDLADARLVAPSELMEALDAGISVLRPGLPPVHNDRAARLATRAGTTAGSPDVPGDRVFGDDGHTPVPAAEQGPVRAFAGEEFAGLRHWVGRPGEQVAVEMSARRLTRSDGERLGSVLVSWDVTDLMEAIRHRDHFAATVSHELRTPLTAIMASLELLGELLADEPPDPERLVLLSASSRNASLLEARIDAAWAATVERPFVLQLTHVSELLRLALAKHVATVHDAGLALFSDLQKGVWATVDPTRFEQVVDNLVSNAVKYTASGGVMVSLRSQDQVVVLMVADSGVGMSPGEQQRVFERLYRAPHAKAAGVHGLGIGLHLVKSIVERHLGSIDLVSAPGMGTTVVVSVPGGAAPDPAPEVVGASDGAGAGGAVRPTAVERFTSVVAALAADQDGEFDLVELLHDVARDAADLGGDVVAAGLLLGDRGHALRHMAPSNETEDVRGLLRLLAQDGPSLECLRVREPVLDVDLAGAAPRSPRVAAAAARAGCTRSDVFPVRLHARSLGVLILLRRGRQPLLPAQESEAQALADLAAVALVLARHSTRAESLEARLESALQARSVIEQASDAVAQRTGASQDAALERLRVQAREARRPLLDVAQEAISGPAPDGPGMTRV